MVLEQYIQEVLYRQHTCSLPKIGTFTVQHTSARYDVTNNTIEAPGEKIIFEDTWVDDGRCAEWIAHKEHLVLSIARLKMDKYIEEFKASLQTGRPVVIEGIGQLQSNTIGIISFTAENMPITWETLHVKPVIRSDASHKITVGNKEIVGDQVTNHLSASPDHTTSTHDYPDFPESDSRFRWWWVIAPVAAILFAALVWWLAEQQDKNGVVATASKEVVADTVAQQEVVKPDTLPQARTAPVSDTIEYYAVIETFHNHKTADKKYAKRKDLLKQKDLRLIPSLSDSTFKIVELIRSVIGDTLKIKDSIRHKYIEPVHLEF